MLLFFNLLLLIAESFAVKNTTIPSTISPSTTTSNIITTLSTIASQTTTAAAATTTNPFQPKKSTPLTYRIAPLKLNYSAATDYCKNLTMQLLTIDNKENNDVIYKLAKDKHLSYYWIDGNDNGNEGIWTDSKGKELSYKNWHIIEPNGYKRENCIHGLFYHFGLWNDIKCGSNNHVICEPHRYLKMRYEYFPGKRNFSESVKVCIQNNMTLVSIDGSETNKYVNDFAISKNTSYYWINGNDEKQEGHWVDTYNLQLGFLNWHKIEPNGARSENCVHGMFYSNGGWNDVSCESRNSVICESVESTSIELKY